MPRCILFCVALFAAPVFAQPLLPPTGKHADTPEAAEKSPEQIMLQFRRDQINLLALQGKPASLTSAALLAQSDTKDPKRAEALKTPALIAHAQRSGPDDVLVWWVTAELECKESPKDCPRTETLQKLETLDAQNAAVWSLALLRAQNTGDATTTRAALTSAAQSQRYDDYFGRSMAMLDDAEHVMPIGDEIIRASGQINASVEGFQLVNAAGVAVRAVPPIAQAVGDACRDAAASDLAADCVALAKKMSISGSMGAKGSGLKLLVALSPSGPEQNAARDQERALMWQTLRIGELAETLADDQHVTRIYTQALHENGSEIDAVFAVLRAQGASLEPTADWRPPQTDAPRP
ncbi:MAG TPA: hypothetical protein VH082_13765 [Rudaea sp.]|jgi:hypothetical protein|nr:hypothetical protein [Rudaea sp.]